MKDSVMKSVLDNTDVSVYRYLLIMVRWKKQMIGYIKTYKWYYERLRGNMR